MDRFSLDLYQNKEKEKTNYNGHLNYPIKKCYKILIWLTVKPIKVKSQDNSTIEIIIKNTITLNDEIKSNNFKSTFITMTRDLQYLL